MTGLVACAVPVSAGAVLARIGARTPSETADVPILCLRPAGSAVKLGDGAARLADRTPGPHDWLAASPAFLRGGDRRGAGMDERSAPFAEAGWLLPEDRREPQAHCERELNAMRVLADGPVGPNTRYHAQHLDDSFRRALGKLFTDLVAQLRSGAWSATGRRASLTADAQRIPLHFWPYAKVADPKAWQRSELRFNGETWFDVVVSARPWNDAPLPAQSIVKESALASIDHQACAEATVAPFGLPTAGTVFAAPAAPSAWKIGSDRQHVEDAAASVINPAAMVIDEEAPAATSTLSSDTLLPPEDAPRKRGIDDTRHLTEMKRLITEGQAINLWQAAGMVAPDAGGSDEPQAREKRLVKKFKAKHPQFCADRGLL